MRLSSVKNWVRQVALGFDCFANAIFNGYYRETYSSRVHRCNYRQPYRWIEPIVDAMFWLFQGPNHCRNAYLKGLMGDGLPDDYMALAWGMNK